MKIENIILCFLPFLYINCSSSLSCSTEDLIGFWYTDNIVNQQGIDFDDQSLLLKSDGTCRLPWSTKDGIVLYQAFHIRESENNVYISFSGTQAFSGEYLLDCTCDFIEPIDTMVLVSSQNSRIKFIKIDN
jgi:hypothetical protein